MTAVTTAACRLLLPHDAPRGEWLAARRRGVTATDIAVLLGISPWDSPFNLYWRKHAGLAETADNDQMSLGRYLEPWVAVRFNEIYPEFTVVHGGLYASTARPWQMCTPDRLLYPATQTASAVPLAALEIKTAGSYEGWGEDGSDSIPPYYRAQVLWQLDTLGLDEAFVCCLFLSTRQVRTYRIGYDDADVALMRQAATDFLDRLDRAEPPPLDGHTATTAALKALYAEVDDTAVEVDTDLACAYQMATEAVRKATAHKSEVENTLRAAMGAAKTAVDPGGHKVATRSVYETAGLDRARLRAEWPQAWAACRTTTTVDKLTPSRRKDPSS